MPFFLIYRPAEVLYFGFFLCISSCRHGIDSNSGEILQLIITKNDFPKLIMGTDGLKKKFEMEISLSVKVDHFPMVALIKVQHSNIVNHVVTDNIMLNLNMQNTKPGTLYII